MSEFDDKQTTPLNAGGSLPTNTPPASGIPNGQPTAAQPQQPYGSAQPRVPYAPANPPSTVPYAPQGFAGQQPGQPQPTYAPAAQPVQPMQMQKAETQAVQPTPTGGASTRKRKNGALIVGIVACLAVAALIGFVSITAYRLVTGTNSGSGTKNQYSDFGFNEVETPETDTTVKGSDTILTPAQVAAKVRPSIVSVITVDNVNYNSSESGEGSGIIVDSKGYIVTNSHVIGDSKQYNVTVITSDGTDYDATVIGYDTRSDLAVLKINATGLPECEWGDSTKLVLGDYVIAIGNPGGVQFAGSVTSGIVSGVDRIIDSSDSDSTSAMRYIQTDAAINPGNSGGALVNMYGQVIGINTSKISATGYEGMGFAIPSATAKDVVTDLIGYGYVQGRVKLGITCVTISSAYESQGIPAGLQIYDISSDSDMNGKAQKYDIITHCDGKRITNLSQLQDIMFEKNPGDTVKLKLYRPAGTKSASSEYEITVTLHEDTGSMGEEARSEEESDDNGNNGGNFDGSEGKRH